MSGVSLDSRDRPDRGSYWCPYRALTLAEWRSRRLSVPCARARLPVGRGRRNEPDLLPMERNRRPRPVDMWISATHFPTYPQAQQQEGR